MLVVQIPRLHGKNEENGWDIRLFPRAEQPSPARNLRRIARFAQGRIRVAPAFFSAAMHGLFEATGTSFSQAVTAQRMKQSRRLLIESPLRPVSRIALACGFESLATFYRTFQAAHGMAPGEFRARGEPEKNGGPGTPCI